MLRCLKTTLATALILGLGLFSPLAAQETGDTGSDTSDYGGYSEYGSEENEEGEGNPTGRSPTSRVSSVPQIASRLGQAPALCNGSAGFVVDCLAERLEAVIADATQMGGHDEMKQILSDTAEELRQLARDNSDPNQPRARLRSADGQYSSRPLVSIAPEKRASSYQQALVILEEAETRLLRSSTQSAARASQYQQLAQALGSNKILLRS